MKRIIIFLSSINLINFGGGAISSCEKEVITIQPEVPDEQSTPILEYSSNTTLSLTKGDLKVFDWNSVLQSLFEQNGDYLQQYLNIDDHKYFFDADIQFIAVFPVDKTPSLIQEFIDKRNEKFDTTITLDDIENHKIFKANAKLSEKIDSEINEWISNNGGFIWTDFDWALANENNFNLFFSVYTEEFIRLLGTLNNHTKAITEDLFNQGLTLLKNTPLIEAKNIHIEVTDLISYFT